MAERLYLPTQFMETQTPETPPEEMRIVILEKDLRKIFEEAKSRNLTQAQFEAEKTKRIVALTGSLAGISHCNNLPGYGEKSPLAQILAELTKVCEQQYQSDPNMNRWL